IAGGQLPGGAGDPGAELYDIYDRTFSPAGKMLAPRHGHTATLLPDGTVLVAGGWSSWPMPTSNADIYHPEHLLTPPVMLTLSGDGRGQGAIQHADTYQLVSHETPAVAGEALVVYCTGLVNGGMIPPQVTIGGRMSEVLWFGKTPGYASLNQVNI